MIPYRTVKRYEADEEAVLIKRMLEGDIEARNDLILASHVPALRMANLWHKRLRTTVPDLYQDLTGELIRVSHKYVPSPGKRFYYFAVTVMRFYIRQSYYVQGTSVKRGTIEQNLTNEWDISSDEVDILESKDYIKLLRKAVSRLHATHQQVFFHKFNLDDLSHITIEQAFAFSSNKTRIAYEHSLYVVLNRIKLFILESGEEFPFNLEISDYYARKFNRAEQLRASKFKQDGASWLHKIGYKDKGKKVSC